MTCHKIQHNDSTTSKEHLEQRNKAFTKYLKSQRAEEHYQYNQCDKAFGKEPDLTRHLATASGGKSHQCDQCGKDHLVVRFRTHAGEKPF